MIRRIPFILLLLWLVSACSDSKSSKPVVDTEASGPVHVNCDELDPDAINAEAVEQLERTIELWHDAVILEHVDAQPELVCARITLSLLTPASWRSWWPNKKRIVEEVGVAGYIVLRRVQRVQSQALLTALFERGAPHGRVLGLAARQGHHQLMAWLIEQGVDPTSGNALIEAAAAENLRPVETLLAAGVDPNQQPSPGSLFDDCSPTPLYFAIESRRRDIVNALLDAGAWANFETCFNRMENHTLLERAVVMRLWPLTERLVEEGADPYNMPQDEQNQLNRAAKAFRLENVITAFER